MPQTPNSQVMTVLPKEKANSGGKEGEGGGRRCQDLLEAAILEDVAFLNQVKSSSVSLSIFSLRYRFQIFLFYYRMDPVRIVQHP